MKYQEILRFYEDNGFIIDGREIISKEIGIKIIWTKNSHTVNVYYHGNNTDCFSIGDFSKDQATWTEFIESTLSYIKDNILR